MVQFMLNQPTLKHLYHKRYGLSALTMASRANQKEIVALLKEKCAEQNKCMAHGESLENWQNLENLCICNFSWKNSTEFKSIFDEKVQKVNQYKMDWETIIDQNMDLEMYHDLKLKLVDLKNEATEQNLAPALYIAKLSGCLYHIKIYSEKFLDPNCHCAENAWNNIKNKNGIYKESFKTMVQKLDEQCNLCFLASEWKELVKLFGPVKNGPRFEKALDELLNQLYGSEVQSELIKMNEKQKWKVLSPAYLLALINGCLKHTSLISALLPQLKNKKFSNLADTPLKILYEADYPALIDYFDEMILDEDKI